MGALRAALGWPWHWLQETRTTPGTVIVDERIMPVVDVTRFYGVSRIFRIDATLNADPQSVIIAGFPAAGGPFTDFERDSRFQNLLVSAADFQIDAAIGPVRLFFDRGPAAGEVTLLNLATGMYQTGAIGNNLTLKNPIVRGLLRTASTHPPFIGFPDPVLVAAEHRLVLQFNGGGAGESVRVTAAISATGPNQPNYVSVP